MDYLDQTIQASTDSPAQDHFTVTSTFEQQLGSIRIQTHAYYEAPAYPIVPQRSPKATQLMFANTLRSLIIPIPKLRNILWLNLRYNHIMILNIIFCLFKKSRKLRWPKIAHFSFPYSFTIPNSEFRICLWFIKTKIFFFRLFSW